MGDVEFETTKSLPRGRRDSPCVTVLMETGASVVRKDPTAGALICLAGLAAAKSWLGPQRVIEAT